ncbi:MAG: hypothetical protein WAT67_14535 [Candidatus Contendobacter sp.]
MFHADSSSQNGCLLALLDVGVLTDPVHDAQEKTRPKPTAIAQEVPLDQELWYLAISNYVHSQQWRIWPRLNAGMLK